MFFISFLSLIMFLTLFSISLVLFGSIALVYKVTSKYLVGNVSKLETALNYTDKSYEPVKKARFIPCSEDAYLQEEYYIHEATSYDSVKKRERMY